MMGAYKRLIHREGEGEGERERGRRSGRGFARLSEIAELHEVMSTDPSHSSQSFLSVCLLLIDVPRLY